MLKIVDRNTFVAMRKLGFNKSNEPHILTCTNCSETYTASSQLRYAIECGFNRCCNRPMLNDDEIFELFWYGIPKLSPNSNKLSKDERLLKVGLLQLQTAEHDWRHRKSCSKKGSHECRYGFPRDPCDKTDVTYVRNTVNTSSQYQQLRNTAKIDSHLDITIGRRPPFTMIANCCIPLLTTLRCNNYIA